MDNTQRLDRYLAHLGVCSRRNVESLLAEQILTVDGTRIIEPGTRIDPEKQEIKLNGKAIRPQQLVYYALNKPLGIISTASDEYGRKDVTSLIPSKERIYPVGRLDKDTTGLIILTNDGELTNKLTHPRYHVDKTYKLTVKGKVHTAQIRKLQQGVHLDDGVTSPAEVKLTGETDKITSIEMTIHEGRNRQIRRMCEALQISLIALQRIRFGPIQLGDLKEGSYRTLEEREILALKMTLINDHGPTERENTRIESR